MRNFTTILAVLTLTGLISGCTNSANGDAGDDSTADAVASDADSSDNSTTGNCPERMVADGGNKSPVCCRGDSQRPPTCRDGSWVCPENEYELTSDRDCQAPRVSDDGDASSTDGDAADGMSGPEAPGAIVRFRPIDGETNVDSATDAPGVAIFEQGETVDMAVLQKIESDLSLTLLSDGSTVDVDSKITNASPATITLTPKSPLENRWYVTRVEELPSELEWARDVDSTSLSGGAVGARFRPDSHPILLGVRVAEKKSDRNAIVEFSEIVRKTQSNGSSGSRPISFSQPDGISCSPASWEEAPSYICSSLETSRSLTVSVHDSALESETGVPVPETTWEIAPDAWKDLGSNILAADRPFSP